MIIKDTLLEIDVITNFVIEDANIEYVDIDISLYCLLVQFKIAGIIKARLIDVLQKS